MPFDFGLQLLGDRSATPIGVGAIANDAECINTLPVDQNVQPAQVGRLVADHFIVERAIATGAALDLVVQVINDLSQRDVVGQHRPLGAQVLLGFLNPATLLAEFHHRADEVGRHDHAATYDRLTKFFDVTGVGYVLRFMNADDFATFIDDLVSDVGRGLDQVDVGFVFKPLLDDLHMQET